MKAAWFLLFLAVLARAAHASSWQITTPYVSGAGATANAYLEAWSPPCATPVLRRACFPLCSNRTLCPPTQRWTYEILPSAPNVTLCGFTLTIPQGEAAGPWQLGAVSECT